MINITQSYNHQALLQWEHSLIILCIHLNWISTELKLQITLLKCSLNSKDSTDKISIIPKLLKLVHLSGWREWSLHYIIVKQNIYSNSWNTTSIKSRITKEWELKLLLNYIFVTLIMLNLDISSTGECLLVSFSLSM